VLEQIIRDGEVTRGWFGIEPADLVADVARPTNGENGVPIRGVVRGGPADRAGIHPQDIVVEIDGKPTRDTPALLARIAELPPGNVVKVRIVHDREARDVDVTVGKRPKVQ
jgi:serine protease DegQ